jgi:hypothetical protein
MRTKGIVAALLLSSATALLAHDLFMKLDTYFLAANSQVTVPVYNGTFMKSENSITTDRVLDVSVVKQGKRISVGTDRWLAGENNYTTYLTIETGPPGTVVIGTSTKTRDFGLAAADFNGYLEGDGIPDVLAARERDGELGVDVWERYGKHIKAIVQVGDTRSDDYSVKLGYPAEIVPMSNPYDLSVGDEIVVQCLVDGKPVSGQLVLAGGDGANGVIDETEGRTDGYGNITVKISEPGRWFIKFINMVKMPNDPDVDYESKWATLSFEVRE